MKRIIPVPKRIAKTQKQTCNLKSALKSRSASCLQNSHNFQPLFSADYNTYKATKSAISTFRSRLFIAVPVFFISLFSVLSSCEKRTNWNLDLANEQFLIVDGIITNEFINQKINLSLSFKELNGEPEYVSNAGITIFDGDNTFNFIEDTIPGNYLSENKFTAVINKTYTLNIQYNNNIYFAEAKLLPVSITQALPYKQVSDTSLYYIAAPDVAFNPDEASMIEVILNWSDVAGYENLPANETKAHMFYYNLTTIDVNQIFHPDNELILFPSGTSMTQKKYSLSKEHEAFIRSLLIETQWNGGNFDIEEANSYTNLSKGALGFFGASSVISYTAIIQ